MSWEDILKKKKSGRCTKRTGKTSSNRKGKKWMACVPAGKGKKKKYKKVKRKKSFRARHNCKTCKRGDYSARCMACRDW